MARRWWSAGGGAVAGDKALLVAFDDPDVNDWPAYARSHLALADILPDAVVLPATVSGDLLRGLRAYAILSRYPGA